MPCELTPDQILDVAKRQSRPLHLEANTVAYFGQLFYSIRQGLQGSNGPDAQRLSAAPQKSARTSPAGTASARNRS